MLTSLLAASSQSSGQGNQSIIELVNQILASPAVGNAFLLIASVVGVLGSYSLYSKRRKDSRKKLERALVSEVQRMEQIPDTADSLQTLSTEPPETRLTASSIPPAETFPTTVYEENASELGLLKEDDLEDVVDFYTELLQHKGIIQGVRDDPEEVPMPDHEKIVEEFPDLVEKRNSLLNQFESVEDDVDKSEEKI